MYPSLGTLLHVLVAALIVKNESNWLPACLESLHGVVDAIVVCDTGSTDETLELIDKDHVTLIRHDWSDDFSAARNAALEAASSIGATWILSIDADERLRVHDAGVLNGLLEKDLCDVFELPIYNMEGSALSPRRPEAHAWVPRLFRNPGMFWSGRLHEQLLRTDETQAKVARIPVSVLSLDHLGYCQEFEDTKKKRNLDLAAKMLHENNDTRARFEMARAHALAGNLSAARELHSEVVSDPESSAFIRTSSLLWLAMDAHESKEHAASLSFASAVLSHSPSNKLALFFKGLALFHLGLFEESDKILEGLSEVSEGYITIGNATVWAMSTRVKLRTGGDPLPSLSLALSSDPFSQSSQVALVECLSVEPLRCAAALSSLDRRVTLTYLTSLGAEDSDTLAEAIWEYGQSRMLALAWFSKRWEQMRSDRAVVWATRAVLEGLNVSAILEAILSRPDVPESLREAGSRVLDSVGGGLS